MGFHPTVNEVCTSLTHKRFLFKVAQIVDSLKSLEVTVT